MHTSLRLFADIAKTEDQDDGTIKVWGWASTGSVDSDGEVVTPEAMKAAIPDYMKFGAVREMHQAKAAGTAIEANVNEEGKTWFGAHVVDSEAVKKVKAGVYKGFSIGGKVTDRDEMNKSIIKGIKLIEVSLVDRPANPEAVITIMKADRTAEDDVDELAGLLNDSKISAARLLDLAKAELSASASATSAGDTQSAGEPHATDATGATDATVVKADEPDLAKYAGEEIGDAGMALACLDALYRLFQREKAEADADATEPPEQVTQLRAVIDNLKAFIASEIAEDNDVQMAATGGDLGKAGARFSKLTKRMLSDAHKCMKEACGHLDGLKYDDSNKAEDGDDLAKMTATVAEQSQTITKLNADLDALRSEIESIKKQPLPGKALLKAVTVAKSDDSNLPTGKPTDDPALTLKGEALALHQIKSMYRAAGR